jgi:hypothetical protein
MMKPKNWRDGKLSYSIAMETAVNESRKHPEVKDAGKMR